jgi:hypothetical protein
VGVTRRRYVGLGLLALLLVAFLAVKVVSPESGDQLAGHSSDAPFGPFAGYAWISSVTSAGASFTVPGIAHGSSPGLASTWIGAQGQGPPQRFVQIGEIEGQVKARGKQGSVGRYFTFWSDAARHFKAKLLFPVHPGDVLSARLTLAHRQWTLAITDDTSAAKAHFSMKTEAEAPFNQVEWTQENPGSEGHHAPYPQIAPPVFSGLIVNSAKPSPGRLYSEWMSVNDSNLAPTTPREDSFTLKRAPALSAAAERYLRIFAPATTAFDKFETERTEWNAKTPYQRIATASSQYISAARTGLRLLVATRWSPQIRSLVRSDTHMASVVLERVRPPNFLTAASFAAWNSKLTQASERALPAAVRLRLALGLPASGASYDR